MRAEEATSAKACRLREGRIAVPHQGRKQARVQDEAAANIKVEQHEVCERHEGDADGKYCRRSYADIFPSNGHESDHPAGGRALAIDNLISAVRLFHPHR